MCQPGLLPASNFPVASKALGIEFSLALEALDAVLSTQHTADSLDFLERGLLVPRIFKGSLCLRVLASTFSQLESSSLDHLALDLSSLSGLCWNQALEQDCPAWDTTPVASALSSKSLTGRSPSTLVLTALPGQPFLTVPHRLFLVVPHQLISLFVSSLFPFHIDRKVGTYKPQS